MYLLQKSKSSCLLTLQSFKEHLNPPPPVQGSLKIICTGTFDEFVKEVAAVTYAVGEIVSAR